LNLSSDILVYQNLLSFKCKSYSLRFGGDLVRRTTSESLRFALQSEDASVEAPAPGPCKITAGLCDNELWVFATQPPAQVGTQLTHSFALKAPGFNP
jgi:hypothetical protein